MGIVCITLSERTVPLGLTWFEYFSRSHPLCSDERVAYAVAEMVGIWYYWYNCVSIQSFIWRRSALNKKNLMALLVLFVVGFSLCIYAQWDWALQMVLAGLVMVVIIAVRSRKGHDDGVQTKLAELVTIFGITISPRIMDGLLPCLVKLRNFVNVQGDFQWIQIGAYKNIAYIFLVAAMYLVAHLASKLFQDQTIMKKHHGKVLPPFDSEDFKRRRNNFCSMIKDDIRSIDIDSQWNDYYFAPLEAEVIIEEFNRPKKKTSDLLKALRDRSRDNVVLILGDPGSGKSTILRMLSKTLLDEVHKTDKIPLYINLKEWNVDEIFNEENPPRLHHLIDFIKLNLKNRLSDIWASDFISDYFDDLYEQGYFYYIFDSFDEIPMLLDETETSWLVNKVSALLYSVCSHNKNTKIILSSRYFRQPTEQFKTNVKMQIKPFSETSIKMCFHNFTNSNQLSVKLFSEHKEMMAIAKNPFYASLISLYYKDTKSLPTKEVDLYESFIISRLNQCERVFGNISSNGLSVSQIISHAQKIAIAIFSNANYGIEIPYQSIIDEVNIPEFVIDILRKSKLIRVGGGSKRAISFSHRRFNEYFVACSLMEMDIGSYIASIPTDSKWRDTLVLYAQICSETKANELIEFCCSFFGKVEMAEDTGRIDEEEARKAEVRKAPTAFSRFVLQVLRCVLIWLAKFIKQNEERPKRMRIVMNTDLRQALHSLRFLVSAFSSQPQVIAPYQDKVFEFTTILLKDRSILNHKAAMQAVPLLSSDNIEIVLDKVLEKSTSWISTEAIQNCSYLNNISPKLMEKIIRYYSFMGLYDFVKCFRQHIFYLSLSKSFNKVRSLCIARYINFFIAALAIPILFLVTCFTTTSDIAMLFNATLMKDIQTNSFFGWVVLLGLWIAQSGITRLENFFPTNLTTRSIGLSGRFYLNPLFIIAFGIISHNIYVFLTCLLLPSKTDLVYYVYKICNNYKSLFEMLKKRYRLMLITSIFMSLVVLIFVMLSFVLKKYFTILFLSVIVLCTISSLIVYMIDFAKDHYRFQKLEFLGNCDRQLISKTLNNFSTVFYQRKYLVCLREKNINAYGEWKDSIFPRLYNHDLDVMLAKLEEKWSGY